MKQSVIIGVVFVVLVIVAVLFVRGESATLKYKDYPYWVLDDHGKERWCIPPAGLSDPALCWSEGIKSECVPLLAEEGFIGECKEDDAKVS